MRPRKILEGAHVEAPVVNWWNKLGLLPCRKLNGLGHRAWPDRLFPIPGGRPFLIEFKKPGETLSPLQAELHKRLLKNGYDVEVHDDKEKAIAAIKKRLDDAGFDGRKASRELAPTQLPEEGDTVPSRARSSRAVPRSRAR